MKKDTLLSSENVTSNSILDQIGSFGRFQKLLFVFLVACMLWWSAFNETSVLFMIAEPPWRCKQNSSVCNITGPVAIGDSNYNYRCDIPRSEWEFVDEYTSLITQFDLVCKQSEYGATLYTLKNCGSGASSIIMGFISDRFGRKVAFFLSGWIGMVAMFVNQFSPAYAMAATMIFIQGIGIGGCVTIGPTAVLEYIGMKYRGILGNYIWICYGVGFMVFSLIAYLSRDWKLLILILFCTGAPLLFMYRWVPESLRWLVVHRRFDQAQRTIKRIAKTNRKTISGDITLPHYEDNKSTDRTGDIRLLFRPGYRACTIVIMYNALTNALIYSGLHLVAPNLGGSVYLNWFLAGLAELVSTLLAGYLHTRYGRKRVTAICEILAALSTLGSVFLMMYGDGTTGYLVGNIICSMVLATFFTVVAFNGIILMTNEIYPTVARTIATGTEMVVTHIGNIISGYIVYTSRVHPVLPFAIMAINAFLAAVLCLLFLNETKNQPMTEVFLDRKKDDDKLLYEGVDES